MINHQGSVTHTDLRSRNILSLRLSERTLCLSSFLSIDTLNVRPNAIQNYTKVRKTFKVCKKKTVNKSKHKKSYRWSKSIQLFLASLYSSFALDNAQQLLNKKTQHSSLSACVSIICLWRYSTVWIEFLILRTYFNLITKRLLEIFQNI